MSDNKLNLPGGAGGLMRYDEEYGSNIMLNPAHVVVFLVIFLLLVLALKIFWPIAA